MTKCHNISTWKVAWKVYPNKIFQNKIFQRETSPGPILLLGSGAPARTQLWSLGKLRWRLASSRWKMTELGRFSMPCRWRPRDPWHQRPHSYLDASIRCLPWRKMQDLRVGVRHDNCWYSYIYIREFIILQKADKSDASLRLRVAVSCYLFKRGGMAG